MPDSAVLFVFDLSLTSLWVLLTIVVVAWVLIIWSGIRRPMPPRETQEGGP